MTSRFLIPAILPTVLRGGEIKVLLNPQNAHISDALIILLPKKVAVVPGQKTLKYEILNRSSEDIFAVIKSGNVQGWDDLKLPGIGRMAGSGRCRGMESRHESLRLL